MNCNLQALLLYVMELLTIGGHPFYQYQREKLRERKGPRVYCILLFFSLRVLFSFLVNYRSHFSTEYAMKQEEDTFKEPEPIRSPRQRQVQSASFTKGVLEQPRFVHDNPLTTSQGKHITVSALFR